jgi:cyanate permease
MCYILPSPDSTKLEVLISLGLIIIGSIQYIIRNWLPTFGIQKGISDMQQGAMMVAIFSVCHTTFRFGFGALKKKDSSKLAASNWGQLLSAFICTLLAVFGFNS